MTITKILLTLLTIGLISCNSSTANKKLIIRDSYSQIKLVGAMKNVMWKGALGSNIYLDTISNKKGLYGLGPVSYLTGEILINNGISYVSEVTSDSTMIVEKRFDISAPFFVYANITDWKQIALPVDVKTIKDVENYIDKNTTDYKRPFSFKLIGEVASASIHIQNLPLGTKVTSPKEAHQGQINYNLNNESVEIIGFFSRTHKGVFTHHDSFLHMHLITKDEKKMGHLDELEIANMTLYLPVK